VRARSQLVVGLTGGIAAGKSVALDRFRHLGAVVVDSDDLAHDVLAPGTAGLDAVIERFGHGVIAADGSLDRARLGEIVFADADERAALEAIVHPRVRVEVHRLIAAAASDAIVVNAVPLLVEAGLVADYDRIIVLESATEVRLIRLARARGMSREQALSRIAIMAGDEARRAVAWRVITNDGSLEELYAQIDDVWDQLRSEPH
jgi:dephospho-CoA kinase